jgi:hypothetical protein
VHMAHILVVGNELIVRERENLKKKKKETQAVQTTEMTQTFQPSKSIKKKGCGCGKKTNK